MPPFARPLGDPPEGKRVIETRKTRNEKNKKEKKGGKRDASFRDGLEIGLDTVDVRVDRESDRRAAWNSGHVAK